MREETATHLRSEFERTQRDAEEAISARDAEISGLTDYARSLQTELEKVARDAQEQLAGRDATIDELREYAGALKSEADKLTREAEAQAAAREAEIGRLTSHVRSLETELERLGEDAAAHQEKHADLERVMQSLRAENVEIREAAREQNRHWAERLDEAQERLIETAHASKLGHQVRHRLKMIIRRVRSGGPRT